MGNDMIEAAVDIVSDLTFKDKLFNSIKKILIILTLVIVIFKLLKWWANNIRLAWKLQLEDDPVWGTVIWIKLWRYIYGFAIAMILQYYFDILEHILEWIDIIVNFIN